MDIDQVQPITTIIIGKGLLIKEMDITPTRARKTVKLGIFGYDPILNI